MCLLGCDIGSSSIKVSIVDEETGLTIGADFYPKEEAPIKALRPGWAEQNPEDWWSYVKIAMKGAMSKAKVKGEDIKAIGISYQMHLFKACISWRLVDRSICMAWWLLSRRCWCFVHLLSGAIAVLFLMASVRLRI